MATNKHIDKICIVVIALTLALTILFMCGESIGIAVASRTVKYESTLFDTSYVHKIDIVLDDWDSFITNCENEEYVNCTVVVDGVKYTNIALRAKGNTSLSTVSSMGSQRYSFKLEFDHNESGKSLDGLDKLCLNNLIQDNTMMKDYIVYQLMADFGVDTPLCSYAYLTVNGEDWGLYLAVEGIEDSFISRNYSSEGGEIYKPDSISIGGGRGNGKGFDINDLDFSGSDSSESADRGTTDTESTQNGAPATTPDMSSFMGGGFSFGGNNGGSTEPPSTDFDASGVDMSNFSNMMGGGFGLGGDDVKLQYIDDDPSSYSNIFDNAKTDISETDKKRLINSLYKLTNYTDLEEVLDMDEVLRYFVVHVFVCNSDSYTGSMIHNYYLHESDGQLSMIPWDYNLAFGTFTGGTGTSTVNSSIDSPVASGSVDERPMVGWIFSDEEYTEAYHTLFAEFIEKWFSNGQLEELIEETAEMIRPYVEKDPTKFCTLEEFDTGVETLKSFCTLRAEAVSRQLEGDTTTVNADDLNLSLMGSMGGSSMGGGMDFGSMPSGNFSQGSFNISSMLTFTDSTGNTVSLSDISESSSEIKEITLSDGTVLEVSAENMRELMSRDFSDAVSITDQDGKVIDIREYTLSISRSQSGNRGSNGKTDAADSSAQEGNESSANANSSTVPDSSSMPDGSSFPNSGTMPDGSSMPNGGTMPDGSAFPNGGAMPDGSSMPNGGTMPDGSAFPNGGAMPDGSSMPNGGTMPDGSAFPNGGTMPDGSSFPAGTNGNDGVYNRDSSFNIVSLSTESGDNNGNTQNASGAPDMSAFSGSFDFGNMGTPPTDASGNSSSRPDSGNFDFSSFSPSSSVPGMSGGSSTSSDTSNWILVGASAVVLIAGLIIAVKKKY